MIVATSPSDLLPDGVLAGTVPAPTNASPDITRGHPPYGSLFLHSGRGVLGGVAAELDRKVPWSLRLDF